MYQFTLCLRFVLQKHLNCKDIHLFSSWLLSTDHVNWLWRLRPCNLIEVYMNLAASPHIACVSTGKQVRAQLRVWRNLPKHSQSFACYSSFIDKNRNERTYMCSNWQACTKPGTRPKASLASCINVQPRILLCRRTDLCADDWTFADTRMATNAALSHGLCCSFAKGPF